MQQLLGEACEKAAQESCLLHMLLRGLAQYGSARLLKGNPTHEALASSQKHEACK